MFEFPVECHFILNKKVEIESEQFPDLPGCKTMSLGEIKSFFLKLSKNSIRKIFITGPEPVRHKDFIEIINIAHSAGLRIDIRTNGLVLDKTVINRLHGKAASVIIDLIGGEKRTDGFFGNGAFKKIIRNARYCNKKGVKCAFNLSVTKRNLGDVPEVIKKLPAKTDGLILSYFIAYTRKFRKLQLLQRKFLKVSAVAKTLAGSRGFFFRSSSNILFDRDIEADVARVCAAGKFKLTVLPDGKVIPCEFVKINKQTVAGNVLNESIRKIWARRQLAVFRAVSERTVGAKCKKCGLFVFCPSCRAVAYNTNGNIFGGIGFCNI